MPYISYFYACIHFCYIGENIKVVKKCIRVNVTLSFKSGRLKISLGIREILFLLYLIHNFRVKFAGKTKGVNKLIYGIS